MSFNGTPYPKFGQIVILAGGAGSGKGFVTDKLIGVEEFEFDVDEFKSLVVRSSGIIKKVKETYGFDLSTLDAKKAGQEKVLKDPANVSKLHEIVGDILNIDNKKLKALYNSALFSPKDRKPNIIFDVTLKDLRKLDNITRNVKEIGYDSKNIHIVWIVNDIEIAKKLNQERDRTVPVEILIDTHRSVSQTMRAVVDMGEELKKYMDGDIVLAFNKVDVDNKIFDNELVKRKDEKSKFSKSDVGYIKNEDYVYIKKSGSPVQSIDSISKSTRDKISKSVPNNLSWV